MAGCGNIARPWTSCCDISSETKRILSVAVVVLIDDFKLSRYGEHTDMILQTLMGRYSEGNIQFAMSDVSMAYCYALYKLQQEDDMGRKSDLVRELVTGLLLEIYSNHLTSLPAHQINGMADRTAETQYRDYFPIQEWIYRFLSAKCRSVPQWRRRSVCTSASAGHS